MLSKPARPLLHVLHVVIFAAVLLKRRISWFLSTGWRHTISAASLLGLVKNSATEQQSTRRGKQPKPPRSLAVILADSNSGATPLRQLAFLLSWCIERDINTLFVFHPQGLNSGQRRQLSTLFVEYNSGKVSVQAGFGAKEDGNGSIRPGDTCPDNGDSPALACVHLLNAEDARWPLAHAARTAGGRQDSAIDADLHPAAALHSWLARVTGTAAAVEPDIVLVCGKAFTLAGFPPWLLRFGELYHLGDLMDVTDERLRKCLQKYSSVAQRFGA